MCTDRHSSPLSHDASFLTPKSFPRRKGNGSKRFLSLYSCRICEGKRRLLRTENLREYRYIVEWPALLAESSNCLEIIRVGFILFQSIFRIPTCLALFGSMYKVPFHADTQRSFLTPNRSKVTFDIHQFLLYDLF